LGIFFPSANTERGCNYSRWAYEIAKSLGIGYQRVSFAKCSNRYVCVSVCPSREFQQNVLTIMPFHQTVVQRLQFSAM